MPRKSVTTEEFIDRVITKHGDKFDLSRVVYKGMREDVEITCKECNHNYTTKARVLLKSNCPKCRLKNLKDRGGLSHFINRAQTKHGDNYDYSKVVYVNNETPVTIVCPHHGEFEQQPVVHYRSGCPECGRDKNFYGKDKFSELASDIHECKYTYDNVVYTGSTDKVDITCSKHGDFSQRPCRHLQGEGCPKCAFSGTSSKGQEEIADYIKSITDSEVQLNATGVIGRKHLDIYLPELNIAIEYNGIYWHSENGGSKKTKNYHKDKFEECDRLGIRLIQITDVEWVQKRAKLESLLRTLLKLNTMNVFARKTRVVELTPKISKKFQDDYHLQGSHGARYHYGLVMGDELVCVMTFSKCRFGNKYDWELVRYVVKDGYNVIGGAGKLFKHFTRHHSGVVVSYSDNRFFTGGMYSKLGFEYSHSSAPNYHYFNGYNIRTLEMESRNKFQKHKLSKLLNNFDPDLSERDNMFNHGYDRIWDCGNKIWVYTPNN